MVLLVEVRASCRALCCFLFALQQVSHHRQGKQDSSLGQWVAEAGNMLVGLFLLPSVTFIICVYSQEDFVAEKINPTVILAMVAQGDAGSTVSLVDLWASFHSKASCWRQQQTLLMCRGPGGGRGWVGGFWEWVSTAWHLCWVTVGLILIMHHEGGSREAKWGEEKCHASIIIYILQVFMGKHFLV